MKMSFKNMYCKSHLMWGTRGITHLPTVPLLNATNSHEIGTFHSIDGSPEAKEGKAASHTLIGLVKELKLFGCRAMTYDFWGPGINSRPKLKIFEKVEPRAMKREVIFISFLCTLHKITSVIIPGIKLGGLQTLSYPILWTTPWSKSSIPIVQVRTLRITE